MVSMIDQSDVADDTGRQRVESTTLAAFHGPGEDAMSEIETILKQNQELADKINKEALANPQSPYANKYVGIANGKVAVVADSLTAVVQRLDQVEPDPAKILTLEASVDYDKVQFIGGW
jgi:hypothetical protein